MFIESRRKVSAVSEEPNVVISENRIERVETYKCLGVGLDDSWTREYHISSIVSMVSKALGALLSRSTLVLIYNSLIQPHFDYCSIIWDNLGKGLGQKLQRLQNRAARITTESDYNVRSPDILTLISWTNLETRRTHQFKTFMYKTVNGMFPNYLSKKFSPMSTVDEHNL